MIHAKSRSTEQRVDELERTIAELLRAPVDPVPDGGLYVVLEARDLAIFTLALLLALAVAVKMGAP